MKLRDTRSVESNGFDTFESVNFTAEMSGKFFDVVVDKVYTNKPRAIIRELSSNAYDAHVAAGNQERPFSVQLPTALDPVLTVRDYGVAMTHDEVMHLYTTVFASTKTSGENADDFMGALGLGSKSPFAYTDAFTVVVWLDGLQRTYLAARGPDGVPTITFLGSEESDEERGVSVSFPVQTYDFDKFRREALVVFEAFDVKPDIPGLTLVESEVLYSGDNWKVVARNENAIRQGVVIYPVHDLPIETGLVYGYKLVVDVPIGTAEVAPSREALSMDKVTEANVHEAFTTAVKELDAAMTEYVLSSADLFEANLRWEEVTEFFHLDGNTTFHGQKLDGTVRFDRRNKSTVENLHDSKYKSIIPPKEVTFPVAKADQLLFIVDHVGVDMKRKTYRLRDFVKTQTVGKRTYILRDPSSQQLATLVRRLHLRPDQIIGIQSLPDVEIIRAPRGTRSTDSVTGVYNIERGFDAVTTMPEDYVWVEVKRIDARRWLESETIGKLYTQTYWSDRKDVRLALANFYRMTGDTRQLLAMTPGAIKRFKPNQANSVHVVVEEFFEANRQQAVEQVVVRTAFDNVKHHQGGTIRYLDEDVADELLSDLAPNASRSPHMSDPINALFHQLDPKAYAEASSIGVYFADTVKYQYPLLFSPNASDILRYVKSVQNQSQNS
jgi:hypothetical protein